MHEYTVSGLQMLTTSKCQHCTYLTKLKYNK
jgi:hypothetical protein